MTKLTADIVDRRNATVDRRASERSQTRSTVQSAREKLTSMTGLNRTFDSDTLDLHARSKMSSCIMLSIYTLVIAGSLLAWSDPGVVILWGAISICAICMSALVAKRYLDSNKQDADVAGWQKRFIALEAIQSVIWGTIVLPGVIGGSEMQGIFVIMSLLIFASAVSVIASSIRLSIYAALIPVILAIGTMSLINASMYALMMCILSAGAIVFFLMLANRTHEMTLQSLGYRVEKDLLFGALEEATAKHEEARRRAEEANLAKSRFLATMSHELRTPLNAILGFSEVMKNELFGTHSVQQYKEYSVDIHSSGQHLLNIINEILDLSRIEAGKYDLQEEAVNLAGMAEDCRHMLDMRAKGKQITISTQLEYGLPKIWADERAVRQIIINLLANGIKFTPNGGEVMIKVGWTANGGQYVAIKDNGPGIPEDEIATVLESFGRGSTAIKTAEQGSGLGLPIVKGLVDLHGGQFHLRSKLREGTEVIVIFPSGRVMETMARVNDQAA